MKKIIVLLFILVITSCSLPKTKVKSKLVVLISVDQMRGDYIERFKDQMPFVYKELYDGGLNYMNTHHFHAKTTTAAGHATLATGCLPSTHGIVDNNVYVRATRKTEYSILDTTIAFVGLDSCSLQKVSADKLKKPALGDYIKMNDSLSKSYSVALKDRSAILMGGHFAN
ncbi:MAG: alkaline phosphatase family protein, partial [Bacteroidetes bacterium]|nr:alkaline phosphatase family protein [Bacteroidota bacterium]